MELTRLYWQSGTISTVVLKRRKKHEASVMGEGKSPSANGHQNVTALEGEKEWVGWDPGASLPTLKLSSFSACQHHSVNTFCVCLSPSHTQGSRNKWRRNPGEERITQAHSPEAQGPTDLFFKAYDYLCPWGLHTLSPSLPLWDRGGAVPLGVGCSQPQSCSVWEGKRAGGSR